MNLPIDYRESKNQNVDIKIKKTHNEVNDKPGKPKIKFMIDKL